MPDENGTEATRPDAVSVEESIFGDAAEKADGAPAEAVEEEATNEDAEQDAQGAADDGEGEDATAETGASEELKVVVSIKGGRAVIGVQQPSSDPHIETFDDRDLSELVHEITAVTERAIARWEDAPRHPAYERPAPPARRRNRRQQESAQASNSGTEAAEEQQQTLRLF